MRGALSWPSTVNPIPGPAGLGGVEYEGCESECLLVPSPLGVAHQVLGMQHRPYVEGHRRLSGLPDHVPDGLLQAPEPRAESVGPAWETAATETWPAHRNRR